MNSIMKLTRPPGINEKKQAELNKLTAEVLSQQYLVDELQTIVKSLGEKSATFKGFLAQADTDKKSALANYELFKKILNQVKDLTVNSSVVRNTAGEADDSIDQLTKEIAPMVQKLIFAVDYINKLSEAINKQKVKIPLISNDLITIMSTANEKANAAIAATLTAVQSCYALKSSAENTKQSAELDHSQCLDLRKQLVGKNDEPCNLDLEIWLEEKALVDKEIAKLHKTIDKLQKNVTKTRAYIGEIELERSEAQRNIATLDAEILYLDGPQALRDIERAALDNIGALALEGIAAKLLEEALKAEKEGKHAEANRLSNEARKEQSAARKLIHNATQLEENANSVLKDIEDKEKRISKLKDSVKDLDSKIAQAYLRLERDELSLIFENVILLEREKRLEYINVKIAFMRGKTGVTAEGESICSLKALLKQVRNDANREYEEELSANSVVAGELDAANERLTTATNKLASLKAGLDAATAAALAA